MTRYIKDTPKNKCPYCGASSEYQRYDIMGKYCIKCVTLY